MAWPWTRGYARDGADFKLGDVRGCGIRAGIAGPGARESRFCRRIRRFVAPCLRAPAAARTVVVADREQPGDTPILPWRAGEHRRGVWAVGLVGHQQIGSATGRERVWQEVEITGAAVVVKKKKNYSQLNVHK